MKTYSKTDHPSLSTTQLRRSISSSSGFSRGSPVALLLYLVSEGGSSGGGSVAAVDGVAQEHRDGHGAHTSRNLRCTIYRTVLSTVYFTR